MTGLLRRGWMPLLLVAGCTGDPYVVDPFPVSASYANGVPELKGCAPELIDCTNAPLTVVLDTGTALTVVDPRLPAGTPLTRQHTSIDLDAEGPNGDIVTRARFLGFTALVQPIGFLGLADAGAFEPDIVVGGDRLSTLAVRLDPAAGKLFFFPNIAGADEVLARECSAVMPTTRLGGGDYLLNGAEVGFPATRLVVGSCLNLDGNPQRDVPSEQRRPKGRGANALLVVATGLPVTVLSRSAWLRACAQDLELRAGDKTACDDITRGTLHFPGTPPDTGVGVDLGTLSWLGLAADEVRDGRPPCQEMWASRIMDLGGCSECEKLAGHCPCTGTAVTCRAGASAEVAGPIQVAILEDDSPILQSLRDELRPVIADVDGFLGMNALRPFVTDLDYPGSRLIFRCENAQSSSCVVRPRLQSLGARQSLTQCLGRQFFVPTVQVPPPDPTNGCPAADAGP